MKLGKLTLENNMILSPLQSVSTGPYRRFMRHFQEIGLVCVPMLYTKRLMNSPKSIKHELHGIEKERPISVQLIGSDSESLIKAIDFLESYEFDVLDLNAGCPSRRAITGQEGGYLLKDLKMMKELLTIALKHSSRPISLKTRTGFNKSIISEFVRTVKDLNLEFITLHARTVKNYFDDHELDVKALKSLKELVEIPVIGNGDIHDPISAKRMIDDTGVDGIMIGRGTMGNPRLFKNIQVFLDTGKLNPLNNNIERMEEYLVVFEKKLDEFLEGVSFNFSLDKYKFMELKRNAIWLTRDLENSKNLRHVLGKVKNLKELRFTLQEIYKMKRE